MRTMKDQSSAASLRAPSEPFFDPEWYSGFQIREELRDGAAAAHVLYECRGGGCLPLLIGHFPDRPSALDAALQAMPEHILWRRSRVDGTGRQAMVLVPSAKGEQRLGLVPLSAVVAVPMANAPGFHAYYEGNVNGASNLTKWEQRVTCAAGRLFKRYPTIAQAHLKELSSDEFTSVGVVTDDYRVEVFNETAVEAFLSRADVPQRQERSKDRFSAQRG